MRNIPKGKVNNVKYVVTEEIGVGGKKIKRWNKIFAIEC